MKSLRDAINWNIFLILLCAALFSVICIFPYILTIQGDLLKQAQIPPLVLFSAQLIQSGILFSLTILLGLFFTKRIGFTLPILEAITGHGQIKKALKNILKISVLSGIITAVSIYAADAVFTFFGSGITTHQTYSPAWQTLLAAVYGGISEEIIMRLFLMSCFIWIGMKFQRRTLPSKPVIIISIILAAVIFGLGHLPVTASLTHINALVVTRAIVLNGIGGIIFGWLFWKYGLESAMIAHFTTDIILLTLLPRIPFFPT